MRDALKVLGLTAFLVWLLFLCLDDAHGQTVTHSNINASLTGWQNPPCSNLNPAGSFCAGGSGTPPSLPTQTLNVNSTSCGTLDGAAMGMTVVGQSGLSAGQTTNVLWPWKAGANNTYSQFIGTYHVCYPSVSNIQSSEKDQFQFNSGQRFMMGSQCESPTLGNGKWDIWNQAANSGGGAWVPTNVACTILTTPNVWHTIVWVTHRDAIGSTNCSGQPCMYYDALTVDGVTYTGFPAEPSFPNSESDNLGIQTQVDVSSAAGAATEILDEFSYSVSTVAWNGVLSPARAVNWSLAGAPHMNDTRTQCGATITAGASAATISAAMQACPANEVVQLGAGTFALSAGLAASNSNYTLRGLGANSTFLTFSGHGSSLAFCPENASGGGNICISSTDTNYVEGPSNTATFSGTNGVSGTYTQNSNSLTLVGLSGTAPVVGQAIILDEIDDQSDAGNLYVGCEIYDSSPACYNGAGTGGYARNGSSLSTIRGQQQMVTVTSISNVGGTYTLGISPGLYAANWATSKSPQAWWATHPVSNVGIEDMSIDISGDNPTDSSHTATPAIVFFNCNGCWIKGVRSIMTTMPNATAQSQFEFYQCAHCEAWGNYIYGNVLYASSGQEYDEYSIAVQIASDLLVENNIVQYPSNFALSSSDCEGCVWDYNFGAGSAFFQTNLWNNQNAQPHALNLYGLYEGNIGNGLYADSFHGNHELLTWFRNRADGIQQNGSTLTTTNTIPIIVNPGSRYFNFIGNVFGTPGYHNTYKSTPASFANKNTSIYSLGVYQQGNNPTDPLTSTTSMFWGNYDTVTAANRFCGSATLPSYCGGISEVPSTGLPSGLYENPVPASTTLPPSFIYSVIPSWWTPGKAWPTIGPDITGGNVGQCTTGTYKYSEALSSAACSGGTFTASTNVVSNPAMDCYFNIMGGVPNGTGSPLSFNRASCYSTAGVPAVTLSASSLTFTAQVAGTISAAQTVTLTNSGAASLTINSITQAGFVGNFPQTNTCGSTLAAGAQCVLTVKYSPTYPAPQSSTITIATNATSSPSVITISALGTCNGMCLYPSGAKHPLRQINTFGPPLNSSASGYSHYIAILSGNTAGVYDTGAAYALPASCVGSCTGANGTFMDQGSSFPVLNFSSFDPIVNQVASFGRQNNIILYTSSYNGGGGGNSMVPAYIFSQPWADKLALDGVTMNPILTRANSGYYLPGDYIYIASAAQYWQQTNTGCSNPTGDGDTHDIRCKTASSQPVCYTNAAGGKGTSPCSDGTATFTLTANAGLHAPPLDGFCGANYKVGSCNSLPVLSVSAISGGSATFTTNTPPYYPTGTPIVTSGFSVTDYNCASGCTVTGVGTNTVTISGLSGSDSSGGAGTMAGDMAININSPNSPQTVFLATTLPVPWELPRRVWQNYLFQQVCGVHYANSAGYCGMGFTKGGESSQDCTIVCPFESANEYLSYEKIEYAFEGANGVGTLFAGRGNLNTNPNVEAGYMFSNNVGPDNNALQANWLYSIGFVGGVPPNGALYHGGNLLLQATTTFAVAMPNTQFAVITAQTSQDSTPGSTPGACYIGGNAAGSGTCSGGSCSSGGSVGAMSPDPGCVNPPAFPAPNGYPGNLPGMAPYTNNIEEYFCDTALAEDPGYPLPSGLCPTSYSQATWGAPYKAAQQAYIGASSGTAPVFTSAPLATFTVNLAANCPSINCFALTASGTTPITFTVTGGTLPSGITLTNNGNNSATLSGDPTITAITTLQFTATNSAGSVNQTFVLTAIGGNNQGTGTGTGNFTFSYTGGAIGLVTLPQTWVNNLEYVGTTSNTINFPATLTGGNWICGATHYGAYTANSLTSLQQAIADAETCRTANSSGTTINIPPSLFTATSGLVLPQTAGDSSTNFIILTSTSPLTTGQTACAHGIQDNLSASTQPGIRNVGCSATAMSYQLGQTVTPISTGAFTLANGTNTNTSAYDDIASLWTVECSATNCDAISTAAPDTNGIAPHNFALLNFESRPQAGLAQPSAIIKIGLGTETAVSQLPSHIHLGYFYVHGDWTDGPPSVGTNVIPNDIVFNCNNCSAMYGYIDKSLRPASEGHGIYLGLAQQIKLGHNWVEGQSIGLFAGGYSTAVPIPNFLVSDIEDRANRWTFPYVWLGATFPTQGTYFRKNAHEFKIGTRILHDGNIDENVDDTGAQAGLVMSWKTDNISSGTGSNFWIVQNNTTITNNIIRNGCNGISLGSRSASTSGNGGGVTLPAQLYSYVNNLLTASVNNPGCGGVGTSGPQYGFRIAGSTNTWAATAARDVTGTIVTLTLTSTAGLTQSDQNIGDPVAVLNCADTTFNTSPSAMGPLALTGTTPTGLTVVYANSGTPSATTTGCTFSNNQGWTANVIFNHNTDILGTQGQDPYSPTAGGTNPFSLSRNLSLTNSIVVNGGANSVYAEGTRTETKAFDPSTLSFNNNLITGRSAITCPGFTGASCYTQYPGTISPPTNVYLTPTANCTGSSPTSGCAGFTGVMSTSSIPAFLNDFHSWALLSGSTYAAGNSGQAADGLSLGFIPANVDAAQTANQYTCSSPCGTGPFQDH
jgi:hypothetical protein